VLRPWEGLEASSGGRRWLALPSAYDVLQTSGDMTVIRGYDQWGFDINGVNMRGSVLVFPSFTLLWDVQSVRDISVASLSPIHLLKPSIRILLVGTGARMLNIHPELYGYFARRGVAVEPMATKHAMSTFNVLNGDGREVAAALLSEEPLTRDECCLYLSGSPYTDSDAESVSGRLGGAEAVFGTLEPRAPSTTANPIADDLLNAPKTSQRLRRSFDAKSPSDSPYLGSGPKRS
jgi:uncharacterized protein